MASIWRDPKTGSWRSRKVIPADVKAAYGKANETPTWPASLTHSQVKVAHAAWLEGVEARIEQLRRAAVAEPITLTHRQVLALAGEWYQRQKAAYEDNPGDPEAWEAMAGEAEFQDAEAAYAAHLEGRLYEGPMRRIPSVVADLEALLAAENLKVTEGTREALLDQMHDLFVPLCQLMIRRARGDYGSDPVPSRLPTWEASRPASSAPEAVSLIGLFDRYVAERQPAAATIKSWRQKVEHLKAFLGHDDASRVAPADVVRWKDALLGQKLSAKTVRETYLAAVRSVLAYGVDNHLLPSNAATGVTVRGPKVARLRDRGLTDAEAATILKGTLSAVPAGLSKERALAYRWVPWLCAYNGARVNEMTQLRREDVFEEEGVWVVRITPEAGSTKNSEARTVPLHPHLVEQGFPAVVAALKPGPLFYDPKRHRGGSEGNPQAKKVGEALARWVRDLGVKDPAVAPNHGWRHRFKTAARAAGIDPETRDAIQGHKPRTEGEEYGFVPVSVMAAAIKKLPRYDVS
jgi:integrase